jgi:predicted DNA-binding transcriptional regulator YafY
MSLAEEVEALFAGRPEPRLRAVPGRRSYGPSRDDEELVRDTSARRIDLDGLALSILYQDASGAVSERTIRCHNLTEAGGFYYVDAYCLLRKARRTFRLDRIAEVIDYSTGEVIADVRGFFAEQIGEDIGPETESARTSQRPDRFLNPRTTNPRIAAAFRDGAKVLLFMAMSDDELHPQERNLIVSYAKVRLSRLPTPPVDADGIVMRWLNNHVPTRASALDA